MWECRPSSLSAGASSTRRTASKASPLVIEKPNFWSSWAVAMYSCVWASTPAVTRTSTLVGTPEPFGDLGQPLDLVERVDDDPADAEPDRALELRLALVVAVEADPGHVDAGPLGDSQLAARADVEVQPLLRRPGGGGGAEERLAGVEDVVRRERLLEGPGPGPEVVLVEDVRRRAVLGDEVCEPDTPDARARRPPCARSATTGG